MSKFDFLLDCVNGGIPSFQSRLSPNRLTNWHWDEIRYYRSTVHLQSRLGIVHLRAYRQYILEVSNDYSRHAFASFHGTGKDWDALCLEIRNWLAENRPDCIICRIYSAEDNIQIGRIEFIQDDHYKPNH